ncbi:MAG: porin [Pseudomonadota bacterium]
MKLKTLLLGSAAAMIAVTGARAADAVVAEPEPVEYVRVCDMYGNGFFYIPGTETCLNINGYVRVEYIYQDGDFDRTTDGDNSDSADDFAYRARLNFDVRNETDYGTLRSQIRLQGDSSGQGAVDAGVGVDRALISLAGFRLGYSDSFTTTFHGYGLPLERNDGFYGFDQAIFFDYTYAANGFAAAVGVQQSLASDPEDVGDYDVYAGLSYSGSIGSIAGSYIYESGPDANAWKVSATLNVIENLTIKGFYVGDDGNNSQQVEGFGEYAFGIGAEYQINSDLAFNVGYSGLEGETASGADDFVAIGLRWNPVPGLSIRPEVRFDGNEEEYSVRVYRTF